jgi:alginate O-acetyltransferase complex protein AlgI
MVTAHWLMRNTSVLKVAQQQKWWVVGTAWALMVILLCLSQKSSDSFIYFQF